METILSLPLEKKIGQLFFIGIPGPEFDERTRRLVRDIEPGGVCLFARNIREAGKTRELLDSIITASDIAPLLSVDQEGGLVDRLRRVAEPMPAASALKSADDAAELGSITAELLRLLGFNMNFAPVVDVIDEERTRLHNGLYSRAFGHSAIDASLFSSAYIAELQSGGISGCLKHFPGLGATEVDSHEELPVVKLSAEDLEAIDLAPYRTHIQSGAARAVMLAHAAFPAHYLQERDADGRLLPSSLSSSFVNDLLRGKLGFDGVTITDDMEMGAIIKNYGIGTAAVIAVSAGVDMLAICNDEGRIREAFGAVLDAVGRGEIDEARIDESLQRIGRLKNLIEPAPEFSSDRLAALSERIRLLKGRL